LVKNQPILQIFGVQKMNKFDMFMKLPTTPLKLG